MSAGEGVESLVCVEPSVRSYQALCGFAADLGRGGTERECKLYERGGRSDDFAVLVAQIRRDYGRRPSVMKALKAKGL